MNYYFTWSLAGLKRNLGGMCEQFIHSNCKDQPGRKGRGVIQKIWGDVNKRMSAIEVSELWWLNWNSKEERNSIYFFSILLFKYHSKVNLISKDIYFICLITKAKFKLLSSIQFKDSYYICFAALGKGTEKLVCHKLSRWILNKWT